MLLAVQDGRRRGLAAARSGAAQWGWLLWAAALVVAIAVTSALPRSGPAPTLGEAAVEGTVRRLSFGTDRLIEAINASDATAAATRRAQLLADFDATASALAPRGTAARRPVAGSRF